MEERQSGRTEGEGGREGGRSHQRGNSLSSPWLPLAVGRLKLHLTLKFGAAASPVLL